MTRTRPEPPAQTPLTVAVLGAGVVGRTLARAWAAAGHDVILGSRQPATTRAQDAVAAITDSGPGALAVTTHEGAARVADVRLAWKLLTDTDTDTDTDTHIGRSVAAPGFGRA